MRAMIAIAIKIARKWSGSLSDPDDNEDARSWFPEGALGRSPGRESSINPSSAKVFSIFFICPP